MSDINSNEKEYNPSRKREIIKTILIVFLSIMLVLTFCSNTIMNKSLAEIQTERVGSGKLTERIRANGFIESNQTYEVKVKGNKTINEIKIKVGQKVEKDDVLFTTGTEDNEAIAEQEAAIDQLELAYQKALLAVPEDYAKENQEIQNARADLNDAIAKRNRAYANSGNVAQTKTDYSNIKKDIASKTAHQAELKTMILAIDSDDYSEASPAMTGDLIYLQSAAVNAAEEYNTAYEIYAKLLAKSQPATETASEEDTTDEPAPDPQLAELREDLAGKEETKNITADEYKQAKENMRRDLVSQLSDVSAEIEDLTARMSDYEAELADEKMTLEDYDADVTLKQRTLETLILTLNETKKTDEATNKSGSLDLAAQKKAIDKQKEKLEKLKKENESEEVRSKYSGVVRSVDIKPGESTVPDIAIATIDLAEEGYTVKITVEGDKAKKVKVGTEAEVVNNWNGDVKAVVKEIKNDTVANSKNRIIVFSVEGSVESGTNLELSIPLGSGSYDAIVPKSAVHKDDKGNYVLTVVSRNSPLGNRYYAEREAVELIVSDETSYAIQGNVTSGDFIITNASKSVHPRDQVRMKDK